MIWGYTEMFPKLYNIFAHWSSAVTLSLICSNKLTGYDPIKNHCLGIQTVSERGGRENFAFKFCSEKKYENILRKEISWIVQDPGGEVIFLFFTLLILQSPFTKRLMVRFSNLFPLNQCKSQQPGFTVLCLCWTVTESWATKIKLRIIFQVIINPCSSPEINVTVIVFLQEFVYTRLSVMTKWHFFYYFVYNTLIP